MNRSDSTLLLIISKVGHAVEEIRLRSLDNIIKKLDHGLVNEETLLQTNELMVNLLKWFNFPNVTNQEEVLKLILRLCKSAIGHEQLLKLNAVTFLSDLKSNLSDEKLHELLDEIVTQLFYIKNADVSSVQSSGSSSTSPTFSNPIVNDVQSAPIMESNFANQGNSRSYKHSEYVGFKLISIPRIYVSNTDLNILSSTNKSLLSTDVHIISKSLDFLMDVAMKDFPPEVFLQYSQLLKNVILLSNGNRDVNLSQKAVKCLQSYVKSLNMRANCAQDAEFYSIKQVTQCNHSYNTADSYKSSVSSNSSRPRGDGQDGDNNDYLTRFHGDIDFVEGDRSMEISLPQFCLLLFANNSLQRSSNPGVLSSVLELLHLTCDLLSLCINKRIWDDSSDLASLLREQMLNSYEAISASILFHYAKYKEESSKRKIHRLAFCGMIDVWIKLLKVSITPIMFGSLELPKLCVEGLLISAMDYLIFKHKPNLHASCIDYLFAIKHSNGEAIYSEAFKLTKSLKSSAECVSMKDNLVIDLFYQQVKEAIGCLYYFQNYEVIDMFVEKFMQEIVRKGEVTLGFHIMTSLLNYSNNDVRKTMYIKCLDIIKECFSNAGDSKFESRKLNKLKIFANVEVLKQIIKCGFEDNVEEIQTTAKQIIGLLINHRLLLPEDLWAEYIQCVLPLIPLLLSYCDNSSMLGLAMFSLLENDSDFTTVELIKINIRLLFLKDKLIRSRTVPRIAWLLAKDREALYRLPPLAQLNAAVLTDAFVNAKLLQTNSEVANSEHDVSLLLRVFQNVDSDISTRNRAGYHLSSSLNDDGLFNQFKSQQGCEQMIKILHSVVSVDIDSRIKEENHKLLPVALEVLWKVVVNCSSYFELFCTESVYYTLLRILILKHKDEHIVGFISSILAIVIFPSVFEINTKRNTMTIMASFHNAYDKFQFPFVDIKRCDNVYTEANHFEVIENQLLDSFLRFAWTDLSDNKSQRFSLNPNEEELQAIMLNSKTGKNSLNEIIMANSHKSVISALKMLPLEIIANCNEGKCELDLCLFQTSFERFVTVPPKSNADKSLLKSILQFFNFSLKWCSGIAEQLLEKMYHMFLIPNGAFQHLICVVDDHFQCDNSENNRSYCPLTKEMFKFVIALLSTTPYLNGLTISALERSSLPIFVRFALQQFRLNDAPQFYNLASLEATLHCLIHITARPAFSQGVNGESSLNICQLLISSLIEVITAFHLNRDSSQHSYMGRGVTLSATICLSQIAREMTIVCKDEEWVSYWLYNYDSQDETLSLNWLIPLWTHVDVEIRAASMDIVSSLTKTKTGCKTVMSHIHQLSGGLWAVALTFLLDHTESCLVRQQSAVVLTNLTAHLIQEEPNSIGTAGVWHGPIISDPQSQGPQVGLPALLLMLQRSNFIKEMTVIMSHVYFFSTLSSSLINHFNKSLNLNSLKINDDFSVVEQPTDITNTNFTGNETLLQESVGNSMTELQHLSLSTCSLIRSICQLLKNLISLAPTEIMPLMKSVNMSEHLARLFDVCHSALSNNSVNKFGSIIISEIVDLLNELLKLLAVCCLTTPRLCSTLVNSRLTGRLFDLLSIKFKDVLDVSKMWNSTYTLSIIIMSNINMVEIALIFNNVYEKIPVIIENMELVTSCKKYEEAIHCSLMWFIQFLSSDHIPEEPLNNATNDFKSYKNIFDSEDPRIDDRKAGFILFKLLLSLHQRIPHVPKTKNEMDMLPLTVSSMMSLLAVSVSGKMAALENGLILKVLERLTSISNHIIMLPLENKNSKSTKANNEALYRNLIGHWNILKNLMHNFVEAKNCASELPMCSTLSLFWNFAINDSVRVLPAYLSLLCTFVANCPAAGKSMCASLDNNKKVGNSSLLGDILKYCQDELIWIGRRSNTENLELAFTILTTVCIIPAGYKLIAKSKILQSFSVSLQSKVMAPQNEIISPWWLKLFINLTYSNEGRDVVTNIPGIFRVLTSMLTNKSIDQIGAMKLVRNLCFMPAKRAILFSDKGDLLNVITTNALSENGDQLQLLAVSALWALLANNRKVKLNLKSDKYTHRVQNVLKSMNQHESLAENKKIVEILELILIILQGDNRQSSEAESEGPTDAFVH